MSSITVTGHSLGGALATLCAFDLLASGINRQGDSKKGALVPITCITINAPRVGNWAFADFFKVPKVPFHLRLFNTGDIVPRVPYIGWGNGGVLFRFLWWAAILPGTIQEVFGKNAGNDFPRDVKAEKFRRYVYQHSGHGVHSPPTGMKKIGRWTCCVRSQACLTCLILHISIRTSASATASFASWPLLVPPRGTIMGARASTSPIDR
eukprot:jgi/Botrbrau1/5738/Bobra.0134s0012.1